MGGQEGLRGFCGSGVLGRRWDSPSWSSFLLCCAFSPPKRTHTAGSNAAHPGACLGRPPLKGRAHTSAHRLAPPPAPPPEAPPTTNDQAPPRPPAPPGPDHSAVAPPPVPAGGCVSLLRLLILRHRCRHARRSPSRGRSSQFRGQYDRRPHPLPRLSGRLVSGHPGAAPCPRAAHPSGGVPATASPFVLRPPAPPAATSPHRSLHVPVAARPLPRGGPGCPPARPGWLRAGAGAGKETGFRSPGTERRAERALLLFNSVCKLCKQLAQPGRVGTEAGGLGGHRLGLLPGPGPPPALCSGTCSRGKGACLRPESRDSAAGRKKGSACRLGFAGFSAQNVRLKATNCQLRGRKALWPQPPSVARVKFDRTLGGTKNTLCIGVSFIPELAAL